MAATQGRQGRSRPRSMKFRPSSTFPGDRLNGVIVLNAQRNQSARHPEGVEQPGVQTPGEWVDHNGSTLKGLNSGIAAHADHRALRGSTRSSCLDRIGVEAALCLPATKKRRGRVFGHSRAR
jgi:hypothetical protein